MLVLSLHVTLLLTALKKIEVYAQECPDGWFGDKCSFQCHCQGSITCAQNGDCLMPRKCEPSYFGPGCQYVHLAYTENKKTTKTYLSDLNDQACNDDNNTNIAELLLTTPAPFTWFRLHTRDNSNDKEFVVTLNQMERCSNERRFKITDSILDVTCDNSFVLRRLRIQGEIVSDLCSVYISGGRNVALKEAAVQSSDIRMDAALNSASHAVDGNKDADYTHGFCTHTNNEETSNWTLTFSQPQLLFRVTITNRNTFFERNEGRILETFAKDNTRIGVYQIPDGDKSQSDIFLFSRTQVTEVIITLTDTKVQLSERYLTLCEVETWGETPCEEGTWGLDCDEECECDQYETCSITTGACAPGCPPGFYGYNCLSRCSKYCQGERCLQREGHCDGCLAGFEGTDCNTACRAGFYGEECNQNCSENCLDTCDHRTGACTCTGNFTGTLCTECFPGFYGKSCLERCSKLCRETLCDINTGECLSCFGNRISPHCLDCPNTWYGPLCTYKCSKFCKNGLCNNMSGHCPECIQDYTGPHCRYPPQTAVSWLYMLFPVILLAVIWLSFYLCLQTTTTVVEESE